ncbi:SDR family oxidoreductase (plasmid) [Variovorax paradoxus]|nr:SDR family oxidoreductase [Variovorax paradoxus]
MSGQYPFASATTRVVTPGVAPCAAFKCGLQVLTRCMAKEFGARGIRANAVSPGAIRTDMTSDALDQSPGFETQLAAQTALGRTRGPEAATPRTTWAAAPARHRPAPRAWRRRASA